MIHPDTKISVYFIRHVECEGNTKPEYVMGQSNDSPPTTKGLTQSDALGEHLLRQDVEFDLVSCSPAIRTQATANGMFRHISKPSNFELDPRLLEYSAGSWEGQLRDKVHTPDVKYQMALQTVDFRPPGGESQRQVAARGLDWITEKILNQEAIMLSGTNYHVCTISHGLLIKCVISAILGFNHALIWKLRLDNASITLLRLSQSGWRLEYLNRVPY